MDGKMELRLRGIKVCLLAGAIGFAMPTEVSAQLRTGRTPRTIYSQENQKSQERSEVAIEESETTADGLKFRSPVVVKSAAKMGATDELAPKTNASQNTASKNIASKSNASKSSASKSSASKSNALPGRSGAARERLNLSPSAGGSQPNRVRAGARNPVIRASAYEDATVPESIVVENVESEIPAVDSPMPQVEAYVEPGYASTEVHAESSCATCNGAGHVHEPHFESFSYNPSYSGIGSSEFMPMIEGSSCGSPSLLGRMLHGMHARMEFVNWDRSAQDMPVLATTSPVGTDATIAGQLGQPTTSILFGGSNVNDKPETGGRLTLGTWLDDCRIWGVTFRGWDAGNGETDFFTTNSANPIIARPFLDFTNGVPPEANAQLIAFPGDTTGNINIVAESEVAGGDLALRRLLCSTSNSRWDMLYGYQFAQLNESLSIGTNSTVVDPTSLLFGSTIAVNDFFTTRNQFQGFEIGLQGAKRYGCWYFDGMFKLGLGNMERTVTIAGQNTVTTTNGSVTDQEGLLARFSNDGHYISDTFVVVPEFGLNVGYALTRNLDITVGYTAIALPKVAQAGAQIDPQLGSNLSDPLVGELRPAFVLTETNYWLSGISYGVQYRY